ncbi:MAG: hypothetical protein HC805_07880 [Alkalinema sp. RL_2_19]|nr:hypothetical protein [Alkalinema sp. RL_2_19]
MSEIFRRISRSLRWWCILGLSLWMVGFSGLSSNAIVSTPVSTPTPVATSSPQPSNPAEVVFEGQTLFKVSDAGDFKAEDRAGLVMLRLNQALQMVTPKICPTSMSKSPKTCANSNSTATH